MIGTCLIAAFAAVEVCTTMLRGGIWSPQEPCVLESALNGSEFGGVVSVVGLSRQAYFHYRQSGAAIVECEFSVLSEVKAPLENAILSIDAEVNVEGCDAYRFAPIGHVSATLRNVTITGQIAVRGVSPSATMSFSRFVNTFEDANDIVGCGSSLKYDVRTKENNEAQLGKVYNSIEGDLPISSFSIVNEPKGVMTAKQITLLGKTYNFNVSTSV